MEVMRDALPRGFSSGSSPVALIAGGAGFIGSFFCAELLKRNVRVICIDNWQTGLRENISSLEGDPNFVLLEDDITEFGLFKKRGISRVDYVVHLAGVEAYLNGEDVSIETLEANSVGVKNLLDFSLAAGAKFLLASTVDVFSAKMSSQSISTYFGRGRVDEGVFSHHEAKRFAEALVSEYEQKQGADVRIARLGDVYGPRMMLSTGNLMARMVRACLYNQPLAVPSQDASLYPIFIADAVDGLVKSLFSSGTKGRIVSLAGPRTGIISLIQSIKNLNPGLEVRFDPNLEFPCREVSEDLLVSGRELISWLPEKDLLVGVEETIGWFAKYRHGLSGKEVVSMPTSDGGFWEGREFGNVRGTVASRGGADLPKNRKSGFLSRGGFVLLLFVLVFLGWFFVWPFVEFGIGMGNIYVAKDKLKVGDTNSAGQWSETAGFWFDRAHGDFLRWFKVPGLRNESLKMAQKSRVFMKVSNVGQKVARVFGEGSSLLAGVLGGNYTYSDSDVNLLVLDLYSLEQDLSFLEAEVQDNKVLLELPFVDRFSLSDNLSVADGRRVVLGLAGIVGEFRKIFGGEGTKTYLVLFQDDTKLRPTGGIITTLALLTFDGGRLVDTEVYDVAELDKRLQGQVELPGPLREYTQENTWLLRDSNWSPDFSVNANRAVWFVNKELERKVDGVIGVDGELVRQSVSSNLFKKGEGGITVSVARDLLSNLFSPDQVSRNIPLLGKTWVVGFEDRHGALWFSDKRVNTIFKQLGWDGSLKKINCSKGVLVGNGCVADYLALIEANLGGASDLVRRSYSFDLSLESTKVTHRLVVSYQNGPVEYRNYFRVLVPSSAENYSAVLVDSGAGQEEVRIDDSLEQGKKALGMFAPVPSGSSRQLVVSWDIPIEAFEGRGDLLFLWQKQLSTPSDPLWVRFAFPQNYLIEAHPAPSLTSGASIGYNTVLGRDLFFDIKWQQQK
ncbi:MAG: NAD-dependent epimerase/dehydratase family protein [Candidatus Blackburnbacteria bacterium]|nr:NAD-dependent epimerase/dehydratase family protein [Candidatus Blackburnbacteria bacterium]